MGNLHIMKMENSKNTIYDTTNYNKGVRVTRNFFPVGREREYGVNPRSVCQSFLK